MQISVLFFKKINKKIKKIICNKGYKIVINELNNHLIDF